MRRMAQLLQAQGSGGDTILAHINPQEAQMLKRAGGSGTRNLLTGLPQFDEEGSYEDSVTSDAEIQALIESTGYVFQHDENDKNKKWATGQTRMFGSTQRWYDKDSGWLTLGQWKNLKGYNPPGYKPPAETKQTKAPAETKQTQYGPDADGNYHPTAQQLKDSNEEIARRRLHTQTTPKPGDVEVEPGTGMTSPVTGILPPSILNPATGAGPTGILPPSILNPDTSGAGPGTGAPADTSKELWAGEIRWDSQGSPFQWNASTKEWEPLITGPEPTSPESSATPQHGDLNPKTGLYWNAGTEQWQFSDPTIEGGGGGPLPTTKNQGLIEQKHGQYVEGKGYWDSKTKSWLDVPTDVSDWSPTGEVGDRFLGSDGKYYVLTEQGVILDTDQTEKTPDGGLIKKDTSGLPSDVSSWANKFEGDITDENKTFTDSTGTVWEMTDQGPIKSQISTSEGWNTKYFDKDGNPTTLEKAVLWEVAPGVYMNPAGGATITGTPSSQNNDTVSSNDLVSRAGTADTTTTTTPTDTTDTTDTSEPEVTTTPEEDYWAKLRTRADLLPSYKPYEGEVYTKKDIAGRDIKTRDILGRDIEGLSQDELAAIEQFRGLDYSTDPEAMQSAIETMQKIQGYTPGSLEVTKEGVEGVMNPYLDAAMKRVSKQQAIANQMTGRGAMSAGAFGGSRHGIREGETSGQYADTAAELAYDNYMGMYDRLQDQLLNRANLGMTGATRAYDMSKGLQDWQLGRGRLRGSDLLQTGKLQRDIEQAKADERYRLGQMTADEKYRYEQAQADERYRYEQAGYDEDYFKNRAINQLRLGEHFRIQDDPYKKLQAQTSVAASEPIPTTTTTGGSSPSGGYGFNLTDWLQKQTGCCFIMLEARYGDGTMDDVVRRFRDEKMTLKNKRGYYKLAEVLVPLMREYKMIHWLVRKLFADPLVCYGKYYYGKNRHGWLFKGVKNFWMKALDLIGGDVEFKRENGEYV